MYLQFIEGTNSAASAFSSSFSFKFAKNMTNWLEYFGKFYDITLLLESWFNIKIQ